MALETFKNIKAAKGLFGQLVIGPPGSGKTTYCWKMAEHLIKCNRKVVTVNLDPANDTLPYVPDIDIKSLIILEDVMSEMSLGPNASLMYCIEYLEKNFDWLLDSIRSKGDKCYFLFDVPGQVELYSHHESLSRLFSLLQKKAEVQICTVHLIDSHHCSDAGKFISSLMLSLSAMLRIGLPHVNILTKVDLLKKHAEKLQFGLDFYTDVLDLNYLLETLDSDAFMSKYKKLNAAITSIIEDYSLVSFTLLDVFNEDSLMKVRNLADRANGYGFGVDEKRSINSMFACAMGMQGDSTNYEF